MRIYILKLVFFILRWNDQKNNILYVYINFDSSILRLQLAKKNPFLYLDWSFPSARVYF